MATTAAATRASHPWYTILYVQALIAIALGILVGNFYPDLGKALMEQRGWLNTLRINE